MKLLTKIIIGIESALTTSAYWLWNTIIKIPEYTRVSWILLTKEAKQALGQTELHLKVTEVEGQLIYPYQIYSLILLIIAGILGCVYLSHWKSWKLEQWKRIQIGKYVMTINKPIRQKKKKTKKRSIYIDRFFNKYPELR